MESPLQPAVVIGSRRDGRTTTLLDELAWWGCAQRQARHERPDA